MTNLRRVVATVAVVVAVALGPAAASASDCTGPCRVGLRGRVVQLVADGERTCALTEAGDVWCWGADRPDPYRSGRNPLLLVTVGALLVAGGTTLLLLSRR